MVMVPAMQLLTPAGAIRGFVEALVLAEVSVEAEAGAVAEAAAEADLVIGSRFNPGW